eukprot:gene14861-biopygen23139
MPKTGGGVRACRVAGQGILARQGKPGWRRTAWQARQGKASPAQESLVWQASSASRASLASWQARHGKARQGTARQGKARQGKPALNDMFWQALFGKARQGDIHQARWQGKARQAREKNGVCGMPAQGPTSPP